MIALLIPADDALPCRLIEVAAEWQPLAEAIGAEWVEHVRSWAGHQLALIVDEEGLLTERPSNARATGVLYPGLLTGDVLVCRDEHGPNGVDVVSLTPKLIDGLRALGFVFEDLAVTS